MTNFIDDYSGFLLDNAPTSKDWTEAIACNLLATALGGKKVIQTRIGPLHFNLFFLMVGPSGLAYKTVPLLYYALPTLATLTRHIEKPTILPSKYSMEGMIEYLSKKDKENKPLHDEGCIVRDEITSLFKEVTNKSYLADELEFISEMYDGTLQKRYTRKTKLEVAKNVYVCLLGATTPYIFKVMKPEFFLQGTGNRILYIWHNIKEVEKCDEIDFFLKGENAEERYEAIGKFAKRLSNIRENIKDFYIQVDTKAGGLLTEYKYKKESEAQRLYLKNTLDLDYSYLVRLPEFAIKLSGLHCISRNEKTLKKWKNLPEKVMFVEEQDAKWGIAKVEQHLRHFNKLKRQWSLMATSRGVLTDMDDFEYVETLIKARGGKVMHTTLLRDTSWGQGKFLDVVNTMIARRDIRAIEGASTGGRKPIYYEWMKKST